MKRHSMVPTKKFLLIKSDHIYSYVFLDQQFTEKRILSKIKYIYLSIIYLPSPKSKLEGDNYKKTENSFDFFNESEKNFSCFSSRHSKIK